jgi:single-strand DNA-binding protein
MNLNSLTLIGRLIDAPIPVNSKANELIGYRFRLASNHKYKSNTGEVKEEPLYLDVIAWGKRAENLGLLLKGAQLFVSGRLRSSKYKDKDGQDRMKIELLAEDIIFPDKLAKDEFNDQATAPVRRHQTLQSQTVPQQRQAQKQVQQNLEDDFDLPF